jgi:hypothetical protein
MIKKIISLTLAWTFLVSTISGLVLFISPPGRIAYWANWNIIGFTKTQWAQLHITTTLLIVFIVIWHLYYNWKPFTSYMKNKITKAFSATKELIISLAIVLVIVTGSFTQVPPFNWIVNLSDYISEEWEVNYGTPPYNHAELDTLKIFTKRLNINFDIASSKLNKNGIKFNEHDILLTIAIENNLSPQDIYRMIDTNNGIEHNIKKLEGAGLGKKTLSQVCTLRGLNIEHVLQLFKEQGISGYSDDKFKDIALKNNVTPTDLLQIIEEDN